VILNCCGSDGFQARVSYMLLKKFDKEVYERSEQGIYYEE